jgi:heme exporter protein CcmD
MIHILNMGGYGWYVWPAYCITLFIFLTNLGITLVERKEIIKHIIASQKPEN